MITLSPPSTGTAATTRVPSDWENSPPTCDTTQETAHAPGDAKLTIGSVVNQYFCL